MKKLLYGLLILLVTLVVLITVAANSSYVIKKVADVFAPEYGITYRNIEGNVLTGLKIKEPRFHDKKLAEKISFLWNPAKLLYKRIAVNHIRVEHLNIDTVMALVDSFSASPSQAESSNAPFPLTVTVGSVDIGVDPFIRQGIAVDKTVLKAKDIVYASDTFNVDGLNLDIDTNVTQLHLDASLDDGIVEIDSATVKSIDTLALQALFAPNENNESITKKHHTLEKGTTEERSGLIPHLVRIKRLRADILPALYQPVHIHAFSLDAKGLELDVEKMVAKTGTIDLKGVTNLSNITEHGSLHDNHFDGHIVLTPNQPFFDIYVPMIRKEAIGDISLDFNASKEKVSVDLFAKAKHLFIKAKESNATKPFIVDIDHLKTHLVYDVESDKLDTDLDIAAKTPFTQGLRLHANARYAKKGLSYAGLLGSDHITLPDGKRVNPVEDLKIRFEGDLKALKSKITAAGVEGYFNVEDFSKRGHLHLKTTRPVMVADMAALPAELNATALNAVIDLPLHFQKLTPLHGTAKLTSNVVNIDADILYDKRSELRLSGIIPQHSLLKRLDKNIRWSAVSPFKAAVDVTKGDIAVSVKASKIDAKMKILPDKESIKGKIKLAGLSTTLETQKDRSVVLKTRVDSISQLLKTVDHFYHMPDLPKVKGKAEAILTLSRHRPELSLTLTSPQIIYYADRNTVHNIDDVKVVLSSNQKEIRLDSYQLIYNDMKFFATKPSVVDLQKDRLTIKELWLNDQLKVTGGVNLKTMEGEILAQADPFHFTHKMADVDSKIDIKTRLKGEDTDITGKVTILGGKIHYDLSTQTFPADSDILIVQEMKKREPSPFMDHLTMQVQVDTKAPLIYKEGPIDAKARAELSVYKVPFANPIVTGSIDIDDGSTYTFQGKKFVLERSHVYFTGDPTKPILDLTVKYKALRHLITINITGTPSVPNVLFSSVPSLSKEQILSIILFDSEEGAGTNDANEMMKMMGGAMAKSALNDLGVKIDHLVFGEDGSMEVGKKLTKNITVIYINGEIPEMRVKYQYNPSLDVVVGASEQSESIDAVYIKDFNLNSKKDDDIVIKHRE